MGKCGVGGGISGGNGGGTDTAGIGDTVISSTFGVASASCNGVSVSL